MESSASSGSARAGAGIAIIVAVAALALALLHSSSPDIAAGLVSKVDSSAYQSVTLASGTIYYGKVSEVNGAVVLSDVYYVTAATASDPSGRFVKRGAEIDAPTGSLAINPADIISIENVGSNSLIARGIARLQAGGSSTGTSTSTTAAPATSAPSTTAAH